MKSLTISQLSRALEYLSQAVYLGCESRSPFWYCNQSCCWTFLLGKEMLQLSSDPYSASDT